MQVWGWVCQKRQLDGEAPKTQGTALCLSSPACAKCTKAAGAAAGEAVPLRAVRAWPRCGRRAAAVRSPPPRAGSGARQVPGPAGGMERPPPRAPHGHRTGTGTRRGWEGARRDPATPTLRHPPRAARWRMCCSPGTSDTFCRSPNLSKSSLTLTAV